MSTRELSPRTRALLEQLERLTGIWQRMAKTHKVKSSPGDNHGFEICVRFFPRYLTEVAVSIIGDIQRGRLFSAAILARSIYEGSIKYDWLVGDETTLQSRVNQWAGCSGIEAYRTFVRDAVDVDDELREDFKNRAIEVAQDYLSEDVIARLSDELEEQKSRLSAEFDMWSGQTFREIQEEVRRKNSRSRQWSIIYALLNAPVHWLSSSYMPLGLTQRDGNFETVLGTDPDKSDVMMQNVIQIAITSLYTALEQITNILELEFGPDLEAFVTGLRQAMSDMDAA